MSFRKVHPDVVAMIRKYSMDDMSNKSELSNQTVTEV